MVCRSAIEAGILFTVIEQVTDAVHRVLEDRSGGEHDHPHLRVHEWNDVEGRNKSGDFPDEAEVFEGFHCELGVVSTSKRLSVSSRMIDEWVRKRKIPYLQIRDRFYLYEFEAVLAALRKLYQVDARF